MPSQELFDRFPQMTPVKSPPALFRYNGCGVSLYGSRDSDPQTQTYVATWCLSLVFVPVFCLRAYRVAKAPKGWYFVGREPLSKFAKGWNWFLIMAIVAVFAGAQWDEYASSPAYKAKQQMSAAHKAVAEGHLAKAATTYQTLALAGGEQSDNAVTALKSLVDNDCKQASLTESTGVFKSAAAVARQGHALVPAEISDAAIKIVADKGDADPANGVAMLDAVKPLILDTRALDDRRLALLRKWVAAEPGNLQAIVPLASILAETDKSSEAKKLLLPHRDKLGDGEGARVLGTILGHEGDFDGAYALLWPYVKSRLDSFHAAEKNFDDTWKTLKDREFNNLNEKKAPQSFYDKYEAATKTQQETMVSDYVNGQIKNDPAFASAQNAMEKETAVVPVALDLGIIMLQRAQGQPDSETRKSQLQAAEQVFLAIGGVAGESDAYRLSLGEVDYWLGKQADGRKLFDDYLAAKSRTFAPLLAVATRLRKLGANTEARAMSEEAYGKGSKPEEQHEAADLRAALFKDNDDAIAWLNKCDVSTPSIKAKLAQVTGDKNMQDGHDEEAARQYHIAADVYTAMPRSAFSLNEAARADYGIFTATGDHPSLDRCIDNFQQAVELEPTDSILLFNAGDTLREAAYSDVAGAEIDLHALHQMGSPDMLGHLYLDEAGRAKVAGRVKSHPGLIRGVGFLQKAMVLSPRNESSYAAIYSVNRLTRDQAALNDMEARLKAADLDTADQVAYLRDFQSGTRDQQDIPTVVASIKRNEDRAILLRPKGGITAAVAICQQVDGMLTLDLYADNVDMDKVVKLAEEAHQLHPSSVTMQTMITANLTRAAKRLRGADKSFDAFYKKYVRSLGVDVMMAVATSEPSAYQQAVIADADVKKAAALIIEQGRQLPFDRMSYEWAFLKNIDAGEAAKFAEGIRGNPRHPVMRSIDLLLHPASASSAMESYWLMTLTGKPDQAREVLKKVADAGIPIPIQP